MKAILVLLFALVIASAQVSTDWFKCAEEGLQLVSDVDQLVKDSVTKDVQVIVRDLQKILEDLDTLKQDCGIQVPEIKIDFNINTDWVKCAKDAADIMELVLKLEKDAATMDVTAVIKDLQDIVAKINDLKSDCGISIELPVLSEVNTDWIKCAKDAADIMELVLKLEKDAATMDVTAVIKDLQDIEAKINDLKSDCGISIELTMLNEVNTDWVKCAEDAADIMELVLKLEKDAAIVDIPGVIKALKDILAKIDDLKSDCGISIELPVLSEVNTDWIKCAKDAADIMELVLKLEKDAATMDVTAVIKDLQDIEAKINDLKSDCGISIELTILNEVNTDWVKCAEDAADIMELVLKLEKDAAIVDIPGVIKALKDILAKIDDLKSDCGISYQLSSEQTSWIQCGKDAIKLADDVEQLTADAKTEDISKVIQDLQAIMADINTMKTDCGLGIDLEIEYKNTNWVECAKDGIQVVQDVDKLVKDASSEDIPKIIQDLQTILTDTKALQTDCGIKKLEFQSLDLNVYKCTKDVFQLFDLFKSLIKDSFKQDIPLIIQDVSAILNEFKFIQIECKI